VALSIARHAWIPPQRAALAVRRGQIYYVLDHCWVVFDVSQRLVDVVSLECFWVQCDCARFESCLYNAVI
jgi:hypothetical protein